MTTLVVGAGASPRSGHLLTVEERSRGRATQRRLREERRAAADLALEEHMLAAVAALGEIVRDVDHPAERLRAAAEILNRILGRATQIVSGDEEQPVRIVVESVWGKPMPADDAVPVIVAGALALAAEDER